MLRLMLNGFRGGKQMSKDGTVKRWLAPLAAAAAGLWVTTTAVANADDDVLPLCRALQVPVSLAQVPGASLYGELCVPATGTPSIVQLLVHGATYNRYYSDWPYRPDFYSYVRQMVGAGYAPLNIERLGYGRRTHPLSTLVTLPNGTEALRQVVDKLRTGAIGGPPIPPLSAGGTPAASLFSGV